VNNKIGSKPLGVLGLLVGVVVLGVAGAGGVAYWNAASTERALKQAAAIESGVGSSLTAITHLKVWGAGERQDNSRFCKCAVVARPERLLYETRAPLEIAEFVSRIQVKPHLSVNTDVDTCGQVTLDFIQGDRISFSLHLLGTNVRAWGLPFAKFPITPSSSAAIEDWLKQRGIRDKVQADLLKYGVGP